MRQKHPQIIYLPTVEQLHTESYYLRLWLAIRALSDHISRRDWLDELSNTFRDYDCIFVDQQTGEAIDLPDIDETFGDDPDMRWFSFYLSSEKDGAIPQMRTRKLERLVLLDLYLKAKYPCVAEHLDK